MHGTTPIHDTAPKNGDGATICYVSDRYAATVVAVTKNGKLVVVQDDRCVRTDRNGISESQTYEFERDPHGTFRIFTLRKNGRWYEDGEEMGRGCTLHIGKRDAYQDPCF
jgi:hypothetical protein